MVDANVPLDRKFSLVTPDNDSEFDDGWLEAYRDSKEPKTWPDLEAEYRVILLSDAGAGKTHEALHRAQRGYQEGLASFFIRIEDIDADFDEAFEVGTSGQFEEWLASVDEAWFFLDSVDEARLDNPKAFEKAIKRFAKRIRPAMHRAHIIITSRPYAWRFKGDTALVERHLPFKALKEEPKQEAEGASLGNDQKDKSPVNIYGLKALDVEDIRFFARHRDTSNIEQLIAEIQRANLIEMASRPFDLEALLSKWQSDGELGGRLQSLQHMVEIRLGEIDPDRKERQQLNKQRARDGARRLAAAVTLSNEAGILVPDITHERTGIDAETVLADWENPTDVRKLLERGIFNDILYGAVRFRHRGIRELLAAEWLHQLVQKGNSRREIESLLFREQYGELVIVPRFRPILPWLILFDESIRNRALSIDPKILFEGGDPARLPLSVRETVLNAVVERIVLEHDDDGVRDNAVIVRLAQKDLSDCVQRLIKQHAENDLVIFFLGRLVWLGGMDRCLNDLTKIALQPERSLYARIAAVRAVATTGTNLELETLWRSVNALQKELPARLLVEFLEDAEFSDSTVMLLLGSIRKLTPHKRYEVSGLDGLIFKFIEKSKQSELEDSHDVLATLSSGLDQFLDQAPYYNSRGSLVSREFSWLYGHVVHIAEILVSARSQHCFDNDFLDVLIRRPALRHSLDYKESDFDERLKALIPLWSEFNDRYFWRTIETLSIDRRCPSQHLNKVRWAMWNEHYWFFNEECFDRVLSFFTTKKSKDDQFIVLSLAFQIYLQADRSEGLMNQLERTICDKERLSNELEGLLSSSKPEGPSEHLDPEFRELERKREAEEAERQRNRKKWIEDIRANPNKIRRPDGLKAGDWTNNQYWLMCELQGNGLDTASKEADWRLLIPEFGEEIAVAFRDAAIRHWRLYTPQLVSEGADLSSKLYVFAFAMLGLEYESREVEGFVDGLSQAEVVHALRYLAGALNGFPDWLEALNNVWPEQVLDAVWRELKWELENTHELPLNYIIHDVVHHAPWLHSQLTPLVQKWVDEHPNADPRLLSSCFQILDLGQVSRDWFASVAKSKISCEANVDNLAKWYALWVDTAPEISISALEFWLQSLSFHNASLAAQKIVMYLLGSRQEWGGWTFFEAYKTPYFLAKLTTLMHEYIRVEDDKTHEGKEFYSVDLRDEAKRARSRLFELLSEIPGKETYCALTELSTAHRVEFYRKWALKEARKRAALDSDDDPWNDSQVFDFSSEMQSKPSTHRQLFDLGVLHLNDFKDWLEQGNGSLYETYQKASDETEMRKIIAHWLNEHARGRYTCAQENPLANDQRPDIWLQHPSVISPVPIELKLLDKGWSGPYLCERLRNQLAGDYLREVTAGCGVFLLVWQGSRPARQRRVDGKLVGVSGLQQALKNYWNSISDQFSNVSSIEVVLVDLTLRSKKSNT